MTLARATHSVRDGCQTLRLGGSRTAYRSSARTGERRALGRRGAGLKPGVFRRGEERSYAEEIFFHHGRPTSSASHSNLGHIATDAAVGDSATSSNAVFRVEFQWSRSPPDEDCLRELDLSDLKKVNLPVRRNFRGNRAFGHTVRDVADRPRLRRQAHACWQDDVSI